MIRLREEWQYFCWDMEVIWCVPGRIGIGFIVAGVFATICLSAVYAITLPLAVVGLPR